MGCLTYSGANYAFDARVLAHVKLAVTRKFRRHECFLLSWSLDAAHGSGRTSLWMSPDIPLSFRFSAGSAPQIDKDWLRVLAALSDSPRGMVVMSENEAAEFLRQHPEVRSAEW